VELLPLLTKLMSNKGGYDLLIIDEEKSKIELASLKHQKDKELKDELLLLENKKQTQKIKLKQQIEISLQKEILTELSKAQNEIALKRVEEFRKKNTLDLNIPNPQQYFKKERLEDCFWKQKNTQDYIEYYFRNGNFLNNELIYLEGGMPSRGIWNYNETKDEISMDLLGVKFEFIILDITPNNLKLKYKDSEDIIEFEK
jgi:hypothetical protein